MSGYRLAVDYGTSFTAAATVDGSLPEVLEFSSARHSRYLPSLVLVDQRGELHVGTRAVAKRGAVPADHVCVAPKRQLGPEVLRLGPLSLGPAEVVGATLSKVADEVLHQHNGLPPEEVVMTHPASWSPGRCQLLRDAAVRAGLAAEPGAVRLVPEPVAAVSFYASSGTGPEVAVGASVAVYDLGGGTFDCAVLTRTSTGWVPAGPPGGDERLGGEDFDEAMLEWVADRMLAEDQDAWGEFEDDDSPRGRSDWVAMLELIRSAKEDLSSEESTEVGLPPGPLPLDSLLITRAEFAVLIGEPLDRSMRTFARCLEQAGVAPGELSAIYLTGGSSRIPAVKGELHRRFGIEPVTYKDPKAITALGALLYEPGPAAADGSATRRSSSAHATDKGTPTKRSAADAGSCTLTSVNGFKAALRVVAAMTADANDPVFGNAVLSIAGSPCLTGGTASRVAVVDVAGSGDRAAEVAFAPAQVLRWLERHARSRLDAPLEIQWQAGEIVFRLGDDTVSSPATVLDKSPEFGYPSGQDIPATDTFHVSLPLFQPNLWMPYETDLVGVYVDERMHAFGVHGDKKPRSGQRAISTSVPRLPVQAVLDFLEKQTGTVVMASKPNEFSITYERARRGIYVNFWTGRVGYGIPQTSSAAPGSTTRATLRITPQGAYGGLGSRRVTFKVKVDGREVPTKKKAFDPVVLELTPGSHAVEAWCKDAFMNYSRAHIVVQVVAGQHLDLTYKQPPTTLQAGKLTTT